MSYAQTDWRGLCEAMVDEWDAVADQDLGAMEKAVERARAALAQQEPEVVRPSDEEMYELWDTECGGGDFQDCRRFARAVLSRWGRAALSQPEGEGAGPTDEELESDFRAWWKERYGESYFGSAPLVSVIDWAKHAIARFGGRPTPAPAVGEATVDLIIAAYRSGVADARIMAEAESRPAPAPAEEVGELVEGLRLISDGMDAVGHESDSWFVARAAELLERQAAPVPVASDTRYEFSVYDEDYTEQAGGSAPTYAQALSEGQHYRAQYQQYGPHTLEVRRVGNLDPAFPVPVLPEDAQIIEPTKRTILVPALVPAPVPVAVSERPWEWEGWCNRSGQCWMGDPGGGGFIPSWRLCLPEDAPNMRVSLPYNALPLPSGEVQP